MQPEATINDEATLYEVEGFKVTTHRVRDFDKEYLSSIMLECICRCTAYRREHPALLVLGVLLVIAAIALFAGASGPAAAEYQLGAVACLIIGGVFVAAWYGSREQALVVACANGEIRRNFGFRADLSEVIEIIEAAKARRVKALSRVEELAEDPRQKQV